MKKKINSIFSFLNRIDWGNIPVGTIVRYILMLVTALNTLLTRFGLNPISLSEDGLYQAVSDIITIIILLVNTWKNNSVTKNAIKADKYMNELKSGEISEDEDDAVG